MAFKMKGSHHYGKNPLKQKALPGDPKDPTPKSSPTKMDPTMIMMVADKLGKAKNKEGSKGLDISPMPQKKEESYYEKMQKRDWDAGSTLEKGDYATYGQQAYDKKGKKTRFEDFESTGRVEIDDKGRPYTYHGSEKIYLSSADEEGRPQSPAKQTKSGIGNIFTEKGRNQRDLNKMNRIGKKTLKGKSMTKDQIKRYDKIESRLNKRLEKGDDPNKKGLQIGGEDYNIPRYIGGYHPVTIEKGKDITHE